MRGVVLQVPVALADTYHECMERWDRLSKRAVEPRKGGDVAEEVHMLLGQRLSALDGSMDVLQLALQECFGPSSTTAWCAGCKFVVKDDGAGLSAARLSA